MIHFSILKKEKNEKQKMIYYDRDSYDHNCALIVNFICSHGYTQNWISKYQTSSKCDCK